MRSELNKQTLAQGAILPVNKPAEWTSFDVVNKLRQLTRIKKVGHAGTLDPFATGVLLVCFASATKKVAELMELEKAYRGVVVLGVETDTHDVTGKVVKTLPVPELTEGQLRAVLDKFQGEIEQIPPMFSALKHEGKRLYELARAGQTIERPPRKVTIYRIELLAFSPPEFEIEVVCSRGTYLRSLARDIGRELQSAAYLQSLQRTRIGDYSLDACWEIPDIVNSIQNQDTAHGSL